MLKKVDSGLLEIDAVFNLVARDKNVALTVMENTSIAERKNAQGRSLAHEIVNHYREIAFQVLYGRMKGKNVTQISDNNGSTVYDIARRSLCIPNYNNLRGRKSLKTG